MKLSLCTWQHPYVLGSRMTAAYLRSENGIVAKPFGDQRELT